MYNKQKSLFHDATVFRLHHVPSYGTQVCQSALILCHNALILCHHSLRCVTMHLFCVTIHSGVSQCTYSVSQCTQVCHNALILCHHSLRCVTMHLICVTMHSGVSQCTYFLCFLLCIVDLECAWWVGGVLSQLPKCGVWTRQADDNIPTQPPCFTSHFSKVWNKNSLACYLPSVHTVQSLVIF